MKKHFYLTLLLALFSAATVWAQFAPEEGKMYALKETTSGLYLDIQTGVNDGNNYYDDNLSLSANPCVIYFAAGTTDNTKWTMKNAYGEYVMQGDRHWIVRLGENAYEWTIAEPETGKFTIARADDGKFIGADNTTAGVCLYCDRGTGLKFELMEYTYSYELGDIQSSDDLMAVTTATHIVIKNCASNNQYYLAGTSNEENWESAILVWEPVTDGTPGTYYLRTTDATTGYIQSAAAGTNVSLGTKTGAQVFYTTEPTGSGSGPTLCNAIGDLSGADTDNLVRFVQNGNEVWLNCQASGGSPKYTGTANSAYGVWTVHNVYAVNVTTNLTEAVFEDTDPYVLLKAPTTGNYLSLIASGTTAISFQAAGTKLLLEDSSDGTGYYIRIKDAEPATYISKSGNNTWDVTTSTTAYTWFVSEPDTDGYVTISHVNGNLGHDGNQNAGTGIYANVGPDCNKWLIEEYNVGTVGYTFQITNPTGEAVSATYNGNAVSAGETIEIEGLVDKSLFDATDVEGYTWSVVVNSGEKTITIVYVEKYNGSYYLKTSSGTYLNLTPHASLSTSATFQATGTEFYIEPSGDNYYITQLNSNPVKYFTVSSSNAYDVTTSTTAFAWFISVPDADGYVTITKASNSEHRLGHDGNQNAGTGVFANVGTGCNTWQLVKVGPLDYTFAVTNPTGEAVSATYNGNAISAGETISIDGRVDTSLFSANEIEGYSWKVELDPDTRTITLVYEKKYNWSIVGLPDGAAVTYNSAAVADGGIVGVDYDSQYLAVTCPNGYTWAVTRDNENKIITITFTQLQSEENPQSVVDLLNRIGGEGTADKFKIVLDPSLNYTADQFSINGEDGKVLIKGTTISAITTGIGWYLQNYAHINIAWNSLNEKTADGGAYADLSDIPVPTGEETRTSDAMYRYYLNYCTFGYSMTTWTWKRWQQEIDWMALHGINMPLQIIGLEEVWRRFLLNYGYTNEEAKAFVPGPAFTAWWGMNNLEGWGGTDAGGWGGVQDDAWYTRQTNLATLILSRQRELGMQPVLPGWSAMVPTNFQAKSGRTTRANGGTWCGFTRPLLLSVSNSDYAEIAAGYYKCLKEVMGESKYYSMDPFHEYGGEGTTEDYRAIYEALEQAKPGAKWVIQQWEWRASQKLCITAVPAGRLIVLDLFSDGAPGFDAYSGYTPQDAVFCAIPNYGGRSGLMGRLQNVTDNYFLYKNKYATVKGIGAAPEAIEQTPVTYDLIFQLPWMGSKPDVAEWVTNYSIARYGVENAEIQEAWSLLRQGPLNYGADRIQGPIEDVWAAVPNLDANAASYWGKTLNNSTVSSTYTKARQQMLIDAVYKLLGQSESIADGAIYESNLSYDLVEFGGGVLADYAYYLLLGIKEAKTAAGDSYNSDATYIARRDAFLALIADVDEFKGTNLNFRLGKWTEEAREAAEEVTGATTATPDWYELNNARTLITTWGDYAQSNGGGQASLRDYSYRSWQGLLKDYYLPRWQYYFNNDCTGPGHSFFYYGWNWAHRMEYKPEVTEKSTTPLAEGDTGYSYSRNPEGNTVEVATEVLGKYIIPIKADDGAYYVYRYLTETNNDFTDAVITVLEGATVNLNDYFGDLTSGGTITVTIAGDTFDSTTDYTAVTIKSDAAGGADYATSIATISLSDGTVFTVTIKAMTTAYKVAREALATLIEQMEPLVPQAGTYNTAGVTTDLPLTTTADSDYYIWTNADHNDYNATTDGGGIDALIDNNKGTYLHTNWGDVTGIDEAHFIEVKLGDANALQQFKFDYTTRHDNVGNWITQLKITGSNDGVNYDFIETVTGLPTGNGLTYDSPVFATAKKYSILRFTIVATNTNNKDNGGDFIFSHMAEFNLYKAETTADVLDKYDGTELTDDFAAECYDVLQNAKLVYESGTATEIEAAATALKAAYDKLLPLLAVDDEPVTELADGAVYRIYGRLSDGTLRTLYTNGAGNRIDWAEFETRTDATTLFVAQKNETANTWKFVSALGDGIWSHEATLTEDGVELTLSDGTVDETFKIVDNVGRSFVVDADDLDFYSGGGTNVNTTVTTDFYFEKVSDISPVSYTLTMPKGHKFATLYLPYAVKVPTGVESYVAEMPADGTGATVIELSDALSVVPAYTPVIVYREEALAASVGDYVFSYDNITAPDEVAVTNALVGKLQETYVEGKQNYQYYMLLTIDENEAFYWIYKEYDENKNLYPGVDKTHIKCAANKAYMELPTSGNPAATYSFRFPGTTAVDEVEAEGSEVDAIYDLQGRKLEAAPEKGIYIVNGELIVK